MNYSFERQARDLCYGIDRVYLNMWCGRQDEFVGFHAQTTLLRWLTAWWESVSTPYQSYGKPVMMMWDDEMMRCDKLILSEINDLAFIIIFTLGTSLWTQMMTPNQLMLHIYDQQCLEILNLRCGLRKLQCMEKASRTLTQIRYRTSIAVIAK